MTHDNAHFSFSIYNTDEIPLSEFVEKKGGFVSKHLIGTLCQTLYLIPLKTMISLTFPLSGSLKLDNNFFMLRLILSIPWLLQKGHVLL